MKWICTIAFLTTIISLSSLIWLTEPDKRIETKKVLSALINDATNQKIDIWGSKFLLTTIETEDLIVKKAVSAAEDGYYGTYDDLVSILFIIKNKDKVKVKITRTLFQPEEE